VGTISGTGSLTFDSFAGPIIATGVASTTSLVVALITHFCKNKKVGPENGESEQILPQEETKDGANEKSRCQEEDRGRGMHEQLKTVMRHGSLVIYRGERIPSSRISSSARF
jgi:ionotropic glutamate receptor